MNQDLYIYIIIVLSALLTYSIRLSGFIGGKFFDESSFIFVYANYISYALVGGLVIQLIVHPQNALADVPLIWRLSLTAICVCAYVLHRRHLLLYILGTVAGLTLIQTFLH